MTHEQSYGTPDVQTYVM